MKKLSTLMCTVLVAVGLTFAQATAGSDDKGSKDTSTTQTDTGGKKGKSKHKGHKGGKKHKKGSSDSTTPPPK